MTKAIPFRILLAVAAAALLATATLATVVMVGTSSMPAKAAFPGENGKIAFVRDILDNTPEAENWEIYTMNPDATNQKNLTASDDLDFYPAYSPDGTKIAFYSFRDGNAEIYIMRAGGSSQTRLTSNDVDDRAPSWQPLP